MRASTVILPQVFQEGHKHDYDNDMVNLIQ